MERKAVSGIVLSLLLMVVLTSALNIQPAVATSIPIISVQPPRSTALIDETFTVNVTVSDVTIENSVNGIYGWEIRMDFNSSVLQAVSVEEGPFLKTAGSTYWATKINNAAGLVDALSFLFPYPDFGAFGSGTLANVTFKAKSVGYTLLKFDETWTLLRTYINGNILPVEHETRDGYFSTAKTWTVDDDGSADFTRIQDAVYAASPGDTIFVYNGIYHEHLTINKSLTLIGENKETTIIDGSKNGTVVHVVADNTVITGFTIRESGEKLVYGEPALWCGIMVGGYETPFENTMIINNDIMNNYMGVFLWFSMSTIIENNVLNNTWGVALDHIIRSNITDNIISENNVGLALSWVVLSNVSDNTIASNKLVGLSIDDSSNNIIYHNNFINNTFQVDVSESNNITWDNGYPSGGNYWSNYTGLDVKSGPNQNQLGSDGIGDSPYVIDADNQDRYPPIGPFNTFDAGTWNGKSYNVDVVSNSTLSDFYFNPGEGAFLKFNVTGEAGTAGFCRVAIPKDLLWAENVWLIFVGDQQVDYTVTQDDNYTYLYFTYTHSTKTVEIKGTHVVPEFPTALILPLLMALSILAIVFTKRRFPRKLKTRSVSSLFCRTMKHHVNEKGE